VQHLNGGPRARDAPVSDVERTAWSTGRAVVGVDEVGRGAWAGPVTVGAVVLEPTVLPVGVRDSKTLSPAARVEADAAVRAVARVALGHADAAEVDRLGLAAALRLAVRRAVEGLLAAPGAPDDPLVLIDGPQDLLGRDDVEVATMVRGDGASISVAAASVVAKVARDAGMTAVDGDHPAYGFARNKGYPSPEHVAALAAHGPCELHRRSWAPLRALAQGQLPGTAG
jgi:ribonuclease HII